MFNNTSIIYLLSSVYRKLESLEKGPFLTYEIYQQTDHLGFPHDTIIVNHLDELVQGALFFTEFCDEPSRRAILLKL